MLQCYNVWEFTVQASCRCDEQKVAGSRTYAWIKENPAVYTRRVSDNTFG
jgi:hypothetical protein